MNNPTTLADNQMSQIGSETAISDGYLGYHQPVLTPDSQIQTWWPVANYSIILQLGRKLLERLTNPLYGKDVLDTQLNEMAAGAPGIDQVWKITETWPSLTKLLLEDRNNE